MIELENEKARIEAIKTENDYLMEQLKRNAGQEHDALVKIHERLDPEGSLHSIEAPNE